MGYWLRDRIKTWTNVTSSDTQRLELPNTGILSAIQIRVAAERDDTARTASTACVHIADDMDKIEVVETGQKIIKSLDGHVCLAHNLYDFKQPMYFQYSEEAGDSNHDNYFLLFGRYVMDPEYGLDLSRHKDTRLEISHSFSTTDKVGFNTDTQDIEIYIWRYIGTGVMPKGYFKTSEKYHYTSSSSAGEVRKELPCLNPYRRILIRTFVTTKTPGACLTDVELVVNDGAYAPFFGVPMRMASADLARGIRPYWHGELYAPATQGTYYTESPLGYADRAGFVSHKGTFTYKPLTLWSWDGGRLAIWQEEAVAHLGIVTVEGTAYHHTICIPFDVPDVESSYFPTADLGKVELILNETTQQPDVRIVLDELVKY